MVNRQGGGVVSDTFNTLLACLLCDFGELLHLAGWGDGQPDERCAAYFEGRLPLPVAGAIRRHRDGGELPEGDALSRVVRAAYRVARGGARAEGKAPEPGATLESIFNRLNQRRGTARFAAHWPEDGVQYPSEGVKNGAGDYRRVLEAWEAAATGALFEPARADALLELLERCLAYVPSAEGDVSLFHLCRATAAIGCCLDRWLDARGGQALPPDDALAREKPFALYSLDLSGIQSFIYTISSKGALKGLRARSFYLSMLMEHISDAILEACGLYRVNLIYAGGGRAQLLLPNDGACVERADRVVATANAFLLERFGASLYLASGWAEATPAALASSGGEPSLSGVFRAASRQISRRKLQRYGAAEWLSLNRRDADAAERECAVCGASGPLRPHGDGDMVCETCDRLERFSNTLKQDDLLLAVTKDGRDDALPLPGGLWLSRTEAPAATGRTYCVNGGFAPHPRTVWLRVGNWRAQNADGSPMTFDQLTDASVGIKRLGVLRADVDNLGALFAAGLAEPGAPNPHRRETLPRYMALSAAMTAFFQREINRVVGRAGKSWIPGVEAADPRRVTIVYSGGDDVFLVGPWNEALDAGLALRQAFQRYAGGGVTLSAGLGLFAPHEPVGILADVAGELEDDAKHIEGGAKDAIALFAPAASFRNGAATVFHWDALQNRVIGELLPLLERGLGLAGGERDAGNAFLYQVMALLREIGQEPIAIARLAYLLARHAPEAGNRDEDRARKAAYDQFSQEVFRLAQDPEENRALQAAILLRVYANREGNENGIQ